ncbi:MAG TPA: hypothetical protein VGB55_03310 [Tepidisphaeraceae bacterium]
MILVLPGCAPTIDAELGLITQSRRGVALVKQSLDDRQASATIAQKSQRRRLEEAFDADVMAQQSLSADWIIAARQAYAATLDALNHQAATANRSVEVDRQNLDAVDAALQQLDTLNRAQLRLLPDKERQHEND